MSSKVSSADFCVRIPARFLKDAAISADAKALRAVLGAFADGHTGRTYVKPGTLEELLGWGRRRREAAQRELVRSGWLALGWKRATRGRWARRIFILAQPTAGRSERSGQNAQLISDHVPVSRKPSAVRQSGQVNQDHGQLRDPAGVPFI